MAKSDFHNIWQYCDYALEGSRTLNSFRTQDFRTTIPFSTQLCIWFGGLESIFTHYTICTLGWGMYILYTLTFNVIGTVLPLGEVSPFSTHSA